MNKLSFLLCVSITLSLFSCNKTESTDNEVKNEINVSTETDQLQIKFAKILSKAVADNFELRELIKTNALQRFDNDNDVLYQLIRSEKIGDETVSKLLSRYANSSDELIEIEEKLPLLTIFVPTLISFTPENWDTNNDIPQVAVRLSENKAIPLYDRTGKETVLTHEMIPDFPVIVVKQNERVVLSSTNTLKSNKSNHSFSYLDNCFNPSKSNNSTKRSVSRSSIDPVNIEAFNLGMDWHRDHVYYGLTQTKKDGFYRKNYSEYLTSFKMNYSWEQANNKINDQTGDPIKTNKTYQRIKNVSKFWTEGNFEFKVVILINSKNGVGTTITKYFSAEISDLYNITYVDFGRRLGLKPGVMMKIDQITNKEHNPNLELLAWDLRNYGMSWKVMISEVDLSEEITTTCKVSSTHANNFSISGEIKKIGLKYGASSTNTQTSESTTSLKTYKSSDELGEVIMNFSDPVITGKNIVNGITLYKTREYTTGWCTIGVEPKKAY